MESLVKGLEAVQLVIIARYSVLVKLPVIHILISFLLVEKGVWDHALVVDSQRPQLLLLFTRIYSKGIIINNLGGPYILRNVEFFDFVFVEMSCLNTPFEDLIAVSQRKEFILGLDGVQELVSGVVHVSKLKNILVEERDDLDTAITMKEDNLLVLFTIYDMIVAAHECSTNGN